MANAQEMQNADAGENFVDELKPGTELMHGQYKIERFINAGGFGITYLASDSLDRKVVIKECFPGSFCRRSRTIVQARSRAHAAELQSIVRLFVQEARSLAKLSHPNIVGVHQVFEDNDTAYMALDFVEGRDLLDIIEDDPNAFTPAQVKAILKDVLSAVGFIHEQGILHRDISPDNILINKDMRPVLIDFGAAREEATKQSRVLSALRVVKDGYSPQEFYIAGSDQNDSSDLYALGASFYHLIDGDTPPNSQARLAAIASGEADPYRPLVGRVQGYDKPFLAAIDKALSVLPKDRLQCAQDWLNAMEGASGNVTALNVSGAPKAAAGATAAPAAAPAEKSKLPLLMGSAAAVALLVGVGVVALSGGGDELPVEAIESPAAAIVADATATVATPALETPAAAASDAADEAALANAGALANETLGGPTPELTATAPADMEAPGDATAAPTTVPAIDEATVAAAPEELATPDAVAEALEIATAPEAVPAAEATPQITELLGGETLDAAPALAGAPATVNTDLPAAEQLRPVARPVGLEVAALDAPGQPTVPQNPETPTGFGGEATETADAFAAPILRALGSETSLADIAIPVTPQTEGAFGTGVEIAALVPGNELPAPAPEVSVTPVSTDWTVSLPFAPTEPGSSTIGDLATVAPVWVKKGLEITSINGTPVDSIGDISAVLRAETRTAPGDVMMAVFGTRDPATGTTSENAWVMPVVTRTVLQNGAVFDTAFAGSGYRTTIVEMPAGLSEDMRVGDVVKTYLPTGETVDTRDALSTILDREIMNGAEQLMFAVERGGTMWLASMLVTAP